jgi:hypothetical protein
MNKSKLSDFIEKGLATDLYKAERALSVVQTIGKHREKINRLNERLKSTFIYLQEVCLHEFVLATARVYDKPSSRNKTRCLQFLINDLIANPGTFPPIMENRIVADQIINYNFPNNLIENLQTGNDLKFTEELGLTLESDLINLDEQRTIIKSWRDKILSHNDTLDQVKKIEFRKTNLLLDFGWSVITIIGWGYLNTVYGIEGKNVLRDQAKIQGIKIIEIIDLLNNSGYQHL